ncbi:hypothetical protein DOTSEDRAFT_131529, partial [Dothistroma septosporum NZE10]
KFAKTYNTRDSHVVTHRSTSLAVDCLYMGERTGSLIFSHLWSYVSNSAVSAHIYAQNSEMIMSS